MPPTYVPPEQPVYDHNHKMKRRMYAGTSRSRSQSAPAKKKPKYVTIKAPRFRTLRNPHSNAIANTMRAKLIYSEAFAINAGAGLAAVYVFSANGLYDPNITGIGHQPVGFDEIMAIYGEFIVLGSTIKVTARNTDADVCQYVGIYLQRNPTTDTDWRKYVENGNGYYKVVQTLNNNDTVVLNYSCDLNKEAGHAIVDDEGFAGISIQNPSEQRYFHVVVAPFNLASDPSAVECAVEITFDVVFRDRQLTNVS